MKRQEKIKQLYFEKKYNQIKIANELNVSNKYVSKVLNNDDRYQAEKGERKKISSKRHKENTIDYIKKKRKNEKSQMTYEQLKQMHIQASMELSGGRKSINNRAYRNWNSSAYRYDNKSQSYVLKKEINGGYDIPKKIFWK